MIGYARFARLDATPGKEDDVAALLAQALGMANRESTTPVRFALRLSGSGIFDAFASEADRNARLAGPIAQAPTSRAADLLVTPPAIELIDVLGFKRFQAADAGK